MELGFSAADMQQVIGREADRWRLELAADVPATKISNVQDSLHVALRQ